MEKSDDLWLDTERYEAFKQGIRALCVRLGYFIIDVAVRQSSDNSPRIEVEMTQAPRRKGEG